MTEIIGGVKKFDNKDYIQEEINKKLIEMIKCKDFIKEVVITKVKNTYGVICPNCGSDLVYQYEKQTRSVDEATTIFRECLNCQFKF